MSIDGLSAGNRSSRLRTVAELFAVSFTSLAVIVAETAFFYAAGMPQGRGLQLDVMDLLGFACPLAIAGAVAAVVALAVAGRGRAAMLAAAACAATGLGVIAGSAILLDVTPWVIRGHMAYWEFEQIGRAVHVGGYEGAWVYAQIGILLGLAAGGFAGMLVVLGPRRPLVSCAISLAVLSAFALEPVQRYWLELVFLWSRAIMRQNGGWSLAAENLLASGAAAGALTGAAIASLTMWCRGRSCRARRETTHERTGIIASRPC